MHDFGKKNKTKQKQKQKNKKITIKHNSKCCGISSYFIVVVLSK